MPTAGIAIIGNEILSGKFADENTPWLVQRLRALGCDLQRVAVIVDTVEAIAEEVAAQSSRYDWVFTTGGVGPTHDDVTFEGVATAFGVPVHHHPELVEILHRKMGAGCNEAALQMARVPVGCELWWDGGVTYPLIVMRNVCIFPGVPSLLKLKFDKVAHRFEGIRLATARLVTHRAEQEIAAALTEASNRWPSVAIGSYPRLDETPFVVIVTLESRDITALDDCMAWLMRSAPLAPCPSE